MTREMTVVEYLEEKIEKLSSSLKETYGEHERATLLLMIDDLRAELAHYRAE